LEIFFYVYVLLVRVQKEICICPCWLSGRARLAFFQPRLTRNLHPLVIILTFEASFSCLQFLCSYIIFSFISYAKLSLNYGTALGLSVASFVGRKITTSLGNGIFQSNTRKLFNIRGNVLLSLLRRRARARVISSSKKKIKKNKKKPALERSGKEAFRKWTNILRRLIYF